MTNWWNTLSELSPLFWNVGGILLLLIVMIAVVQWAQSMPKGAYLFIMLMTVCAIFPIPPPVYKNIEKAKQEQVKRKEDAGDDDDETENDIK